VDVPFPLHLDLAGRRVLVVGSGPVGVRRARAAAAAGALVEVVALEAPADLELPVTRRQFEPGDVAGAWLVLACTGTVDAEIAAACEERGIWCVRADDHTRSAAWVPAVGRVDDVVVSVTSGRDPRRSMALRDTFLAAVSEAAVAEQAVSEQAR
jgi:uroporphyrin-III C-methyltransferase/precorrin-2 dehydrogenase/sirohydrochlorin ferrochelatase